MRQKTVEIALASFIGAASGPADADCWFDESPNPGRSNLYGAELSTGIPDASPGQTRASGPLARPIEGSTFARESEAASYDPRALAPLREEIDKLRDDVAELRAALLWDEPVVPLDLWQKWINEHPHEIAKYPDEHIAIHPQRGIVHHDADGRAFAAWCRALSEEEAEEYLITTSSMYL